MKLAALHRAKELQRRTGTYQEGRDLDSEIAAAQEQLDVERLVLAGERAEETGTRIFERNLARGTEAEDDVLQELKDKQQLEGPAGEALSRLGAGIAPEVDSEVLRMFGAEAQALRGEELGMVVSVLERLIDETSAEQQKTRDLYERVANKSKPFDGGNVPVPATAPRSGTTPR